MFIVFRYSYAIRPDALQKEFWKFIVRTGPVSEVALDAVKRNCRGLPVDYSNLNYYLERHSPVSSSVDCKLKHRYPDIIPCIDFHPGSSSCVWNQLSLFYETAFTIFPQYASITFVPVSQRNLIIINI